MNRRHYLRILSSASLVGLSGCIADNVAEAVADSANEDTTNNNVNWIRNDNITTGVAAPDSNLPLIFYTMEPTTFEPNSYTSFELNISEHIEDINEYIIIDFRVTVQEGPSVDIFFTNTSESDRYESGHEFNILQGSRMSTKECDVTAKIRDLKDYTLIIDHSDIGEASPNGENARLSYHASVFSDSKVL